MKKLFILLSPSALLLQKLILETVAAQQPKPTTFAQWYDQKNPYLRRLSGHYLGWFDRLKYPHTSIAIELPISSPWLDRAN